MRTRFVEREKVVSCFNEKVVRKHRDPPLKTTRREEKAVKDSRLALPCDLDREAYRWPRV